MPSIFTLSGAGGAGGSWYQSQGRKALVTDLRKKAKVKGGGVAGARGPRAPRPVDQDDLYHLKVLVDNEGKVYDQLQAGRRALVKKACRLGALDLELGSRLFYPTVHKVAQQAQKDFGKHFSPEVKKALARQYAADITANMNACRTKGQCNDLPDMKLPAKCSLPSGGLAGARRRRR